MKYRAALGISYGAGLRASEACNLKVADIDSDRMLIHVDEGKNGKDRKAMLAPGLPSNGLLVNGRPCVATGPCFEAGDVRLPSDFTNCNCGAPQNTQQYQQRKAVNQNTLSQQLWRKPGEREPFSTPAPKRQSTACPLQPLKTTRKSGDIQKRRTGFLGIVAVVSDQFELVYARTVALPLYRTKLTPLGETGAIQHESSLQGG